MAPGINIPNNQFQSCTPPTSDPFTLPSLLNLLLNDQIHYGALAIFVLALIARYANSFLPRRRLTFLETALEDINDKLVAVQENSSDRDFVLDARLTLEILRLDVCELRRQTIHITSVWRDICAFCKGFSASVNKCNKRAGLLHLRIKAQTEQDKQLIIKAEVNEMLSTFINESDLIKKPLPCVFAAKSNLHGYPTIRTTNMFQPSGKSTGIAENTHAANKDNLDI